MPPSRRASLTQSAEAQLGGHEQLLQVIVEEPCQSFAFALLGPRQFQGQRAELDGVGLQSRQRGPEPVLHAQLLEQCRADEIDALVDRIIELFMRLGVTKLDELVARAQGGENVRSLARDVGVANSALTRALRERGVVITRTVVDAALTKRLAAEYEGGATMRELEKGSDCRTAR